MTPSLEWAGGELNSRIPQGHEFYRLALLPDSRHLPKIRASRNAGSNRAHSRVQGERITTDAFPARVRATRLERAIPDWKSGMFTNYITPTQATAGNRTRIDSVRMSRSPV